MATRETYKLPGEHVYDGLVLFGDARPDVLNRVKDFPFDDDILLASYPKTGTTWMQEISWLVNSGGDFEGSSKTALHNRFPYLEMYFEKEDAVYIDILERTPAPRMIKTHLPMRFFTNKLGEGKVKIIVPMRNPKDTLVSFYKFYQSNITLGYFKGTWNDFFEMYKAKHLAYGDIIDWYIECWKYRDHPSVLLLKYEDLKVDLRSGVAKIAKLLGKTLSDAAIDKITDHCQFESMKDNKMVNYTTVPKEYMNHDISPFMRKGQVGDWVNFFSKEQSDYVDEQCEARLTPLGLTFRDK